MKQKIIWYDENKFDIAPDPKCKIAKGSEGILSHKTMTFKLDPLSSQEKCISLFILRKILLNITVE